MSLYKFPKASSYPKDYWYLHFYTSKNPLIRYAFVKRLEIVLQISCNDLISADHVLDIGPGPGYLFPTLSQFKIKNIIGLDLLSFHIEAVKYMVRSENIAHNISLIHGDGRKLPFKHESLDIVYCVSVLEHVPLTVIRELYRILKPSGILIVGIPIDTLITTLGRMVTGVGGHTREKQEEIPFSTLDNKKEFLYQNQIPARNSYNSIRNELQRFFHISHTQKVPHNSLPDVLSLYEVVRCERKTFGSERQRLDNALRSI